DPELGFAIAQRYKLGPSDRAVLRARQRANAGDPALAAVLRERQGLIEARGRALTAFEQAATAGDGGAAEAARAQVIDLTTRLDAMGDAGAGLDGETVALAELRSSLADDQAILLTLEAEFGTYVMA